VQSRLQLIIIVVLILLFTITQNFFLSVWETSPSGCVRNGVYTFVNVQTTQLAPTSRLYQVYLNEYIPSPKTRLFPSNRLSAPPSCTVYSPIARGRLWSTRRIPVRKIPRFDVRRRVKRSTESWPMDTRRAPGLQVPAEEADKNCRRADM